MEVIGHRGARGLVMENTLAGFEQALKLGVDALELDLHVVRGGALVVHHDFALRVGVTWKEDGQALTGRTPLLCDLSFAQLQRYGVGHDFAACHQIPKVQDVLDSIERHDPTGQVRAFLEIKTNPQHPELCLPFNSVMEAVLGLLEDPRVRSRGHLLAFDWRVLGVIKEKKPEIARCYLSHKDTLESAHRQVWLAGMGQGGSVPQLVSQAGGHNWAPFYRELTRDLLQEAHDLGIKVFPWTVNELADMDQLSQWGVDGIITDFPDKLLTFLRRL